MTNQEEALRADVRRLGDLLGQTLVRQEGQQLLDLVENVRSAVREGSGAEVLKDLSVEDSIQLARAFSTYFHLANVAEQVNRVRALAESRDQGSSWISRAVDKIAEAQKAQTPGHQFTQADLEQWISELSVRPVFTAHPTEAARRSILNKLGEISRLLDLPKSITNSQSLAEIVDLLWQTDELRVERPEPLDEAMNALYYLDDLASTTVPEVLNEFAHELKRVGVDLPVTARPLTFGTWIGGDRDGNPNITADVTKSAILLQNSHFTRAINRHLDELRQTLSISTKLIGVTKELEASLAQDLEKLPEIEARYRRINVEEPYRLKATAIGHKLLLTQARHASGLPHFSGRDYKNTSELLQDFEIMHASLLANNGELIANGLLNRIYRTISAFGLTHATMDIREHSGVHRNLLTQIYGELSSSQISEELKSQGKKEIKSNAIEIGSKVWIGSNVSLYKGVRIPNGSIIASDSVVKGTFDDENILIAGNPAKIIKRHVKW